LRAQQSSITTLDREQLPEAYANQTRVKDYALQRVYVDADYADNGEQDTSIYTAAVPAFTQLLCLTMHGTQQPTARMQGAGRTCHLPQASP
jgi:hypothetical protein